MKTTLAASFDVRSVSCTARRVVEFAVLDTDTGPQALMPGDWVVTIGGGDGRPSIQMAFRNADFQRLFMPVTSSAAAIAAAPVEQLVPDAIPPAPPRPVGLVGQNLAGWLRQKTVEEQEPNRRVA
ncbi:hypothetical protein [Fontivita pretiosa]|uniref:hypothetical protein n=1 Tax=Fontivita pretiosa TaxID=2989684 RepID=UPI003D179838